MKSHLAAFLACLTLALPVLTIALPPVAAADDAATTLDNETLQADIAVLESLNQLDLSKQQATTLLGLVTELAKKSSGYELEREALRGRMKPLLAQKRALMMKDEVVPDDLDKSITGMQSQLDSLDRKVIEALVPFAARFRPVLSTAQLQIITGDYEARRQAEEWLDSLREMVKEDFRDELGPIVKEFADPNVGLDEKTLRQVFTDAHNMDSKTYAKKKTEIVSRIAPLFRPTKGKDSELIVQFFLHPRMLAVLTEKVDAIK
jgi:hypothetical protein